MGTMMNGPELWDAVRAPIREAFGADAVIAGGAVRDRLLGVVQVIGVERPQIVGSELVQTFDFGITRCWYDGDLRFTWVDTVPDLEPALSL